jgi:hypothetical protein
VRVNCRPQPLHFQRCRPQAWPDLISTLPRQAGHASGPSTITSSPVHATKAPQIGPSVTQVKPSHVQVAVPEVERVPAQGDELGDAQAVPVGEEDHGGVAVAVAPAAAGRGLDQALDLGRGQELARADGGVGGAARGDDCPFLEDLSGIPCMGGWLNLSRPWPW